MTEETKLKKVTRRKRAAPKAPTEIEKPKNKGGRPKEVKDYTFKFTQEE